ncbi:rod-determining factor RdfA [Halohasta litorea]|uniref:Rod-determining factor RdfA n=1 Tax=Halohasta litorea TaxID=869891 RepID=A0ABD6D9H9_9EURY|nr:rod-determining factor RdfA [Halohasta litorea]
MTSDNCCKLSRVTADYGISEHVLADSIDVLLANKWLGEGSQPNTALRPLTDWFNRKLLSAVYTKHDRKTLEPQIEADYDALVGDDEGRRQLVVDDLEQDGIDAGTVVDDLISTSSLYRHLTQCLDVGKETQRGSSDTGWEADKIRYAKRMARDRAEDVLRSWENKGELPEATAATVSVDISVECPVCSKRSPILQSHNRGYICEDHMTADE